MQITQNVVRPFPRSDAALSQGPQQQVQELPAIKLNAFDQVHDHPRVRQQRRVRQPGLVQHDPFQTQFGLLRQFGRHRLGGRQRRGTGILRRGPVEGSRDVLPAGIEALPLRFSRGRLIVGGTPLAGTLPAMVLAAAERTTQVYTAGIPGMGEKANSAVTAASDATLPFRKGCEGGIQRKQVLLNQRPGAIVLMPIRPKGEELPDRDNKKAKFSATIPMFLRTPSSYLTEANASRGRARFFCATNHDEDRQPESTPPPLRPAQAALFSKPNASSLPEVPK